MQIERPRKYRRAATITTFSLLAFWAFISLGCGVLLRDTLDQFHLGTAPLGFWMAQQGSIIGFVLILITYGAIMNRLDKKYGYSEDL